MSAVSPRESDGRRTKHSPTFGPLDERPNIKSQNPSRRVASHAAPIETASHLSRRAIPGGRARGAARRGAARRYKGIHPHKGIDIFIKMARRRGGGGDVRGGPDVPLESSRFPLAAELINKFSRWREFRGRRLDRSRLDDAGNSIPPRRASETRNARETKR